MFDEQKLRRLSEIFLVENTKLNLSALRTPEHCWIGNILDSAAFLDSLPSFFIGNATEKSLRIGDIGTGGGFPLLVIASLLPQSHCIGLDSTKKKIDAVERIVKSCELPNVSLICGRTEELGHEKDLRESFDIVTARAVAPIATLLEYAAPLLKVGGTAVFWKSMHIAEELVASVKATTVLRMRPLAPFTYTLPEDFGTRQLLLYRKEGVTPALYPRAIGVPKAQPII